MEIKAFGLESLQNCSEITAQLSEREKELQCRSQTKRPTEAGGSY